MNSIHFSAIAILTLSMTGAAQSYRLPSGNFKGIDNVPQRTMKAKRSAAAESSYKVIPMVMNGTIDGRLTLTEIGVVNTTGAPAKVTILFVDQDGQPVQMPVMSEQGTLQGRFRGVAGDVDPHGASWITTFPEGEAGSVTWAVAEVTPANALDVYSTIGVVDMKTVSATYLKGGTADIDRTRFTTLAYSLADSKTALAIVNTGDATDTAQFIIRRGDGSEVCRLQKTVGPLQQAVVNLNGGSCTGIAGMNWIEVVANKSTIAVDGFADMGVVMMTPVIGR